jgi:hypothetical protein
MGQAAIVLPEANGNDVEVATGGLYNRPTSTYKGLTLAQIAEQIPALKEDLANRDFGHKPLARKWSAVTTESSVRRYRKAHNI